MGVQASWNGYTWGHTPRQAKDLEIVSTGRAVKVEQTEDKDGKVTQTSAYELVTVSARFRACSTAGADPLTEFSRLSGMVGRYAPLFVGGRRWAGVPQFLLMGVDMADVSMDGQGRIVDCTLSVSWEEYRSSGGIKAKTGAEVNLTPGIGSYSARASALSIGQAVDRNIKKAVNGQMARW